MNWRRRLLLLVAFETDGRCAASVASATCVGARGLAAVWVARCIAGKPLSLDYRPCGSGAVSDIPGGQQFQRPGPRR